jgi:allantoicase
VTIHPDGGIKRVRVFGKRAHANEGEVAPTEPPAILDDANVTSPLVNGIHYEKPIAAVLGKIIPALLLTPEAFAPFGHVVQAYNTPEAAPRGIKVTGANQGSAIKYHALAPVKTSYPEDAGASTSMSVYRAKPIDANIGELFNVKLLERHPCTNQAFFALGAGTGVGEYSLEKQGRAYLVIVALNGEGRDRTCSIKGDWTDGIVIDDKPDLSTLRAFVASVAQGIVYDTAIWHHPLICLETVSLVHPLGLFREC